MDVLYISLAALLGSALTFFSGFGLGTLLVPVFALFFPIDIAIAMTAIVHFLNNIFKFLLVGKAANKALVLKFGIPSLLASFLGAYLLTQIGNHSGTINFSIGTITFSTTLLKLIIGCIIFLFAVIELSPKLSKPSLKDNHYVFGGILSGFFGGLSGNQGALRSMFLVNANLNKESFIATGVVIACMVDIARLSIYSTKLVDLHVQLPYATIAIACAAAFLGAYVGNKLIKKMTFSVIQLIVAAALLCFSVVLALGVL